ncbi:maleylacetate reductase [Modestobacter sp. NPDC049651]|uniref:maleylacetate reductase n=1 Tax=unclassified Modestobacter TaxID=2643866 RepID=UPI0033C93999
MDFVHDSLRQRIRFGSHRAAENLAAEVAGRSARRVMVIATEGQRATAERITAGIDVALWHSEVVMHVPVEVARRARDAAADAGVDLVVGIGGGSTTGLAKALAMSGSPVAGVPVVAVPTTYAGSEVTTVWGLTDGGTKTTGTDDAVLPAAVVYDAALHTSLPADLSVASGLNALAHCVDAMWGPRVDPVDQVLAGEGIAALAAGLPAVLADPAGLAGRERTLYGAYLAGVAFASAGSGLHHKVCHVLGGMFDLPHAQTHAVVLPHVLALNAPHAPDAAARIARSFGAGTATAGLHELRRRLGAPRALRDLGMPEAGIARAVPAVLAAVPPGNPAPVTEHDVTALLRAAWAGTEPAR